MDDRDQVHAITGKLTISTSPVNFQERCVRTVPSPSSRTVNLLQDRQSGCTTEAGTSSNNTVSILLDKDFLTHLHQTGGLDNADIVVPVTLASEMSNPTTSPSRSYVRRLTHTGRMYPSTAVVVPHDCSEEELSRLLSELAKKERLHHWPKKKDPGKKLIRTEIVVGNNRKRNSDRIVFADPPPETWCSDCEKMYRTECPFHKKLLIPDDAIPKAYSSCPHILAIKTVDRGGVRGIFAKKSVLRHSRFGPLQGRLVNENHPNEDNAFYKTTDENGKVSFFDLCDDAESNWMKFVRPATTTKEQNLVVSMVGGQIYFDATRFIPAKQELRIWYSKAYAKVFGRDILPDSEAQTSEFSCFDCDTECGSATELDLHLETVHGADFDDGEDSEDPTFTVYRPTVVKKKPAASGSNSARSTSMAFFRPPALKVKRKYFLKAKLERLVQNNKRYICPLCKKRFQSAKLYELHILSHKLHGAAEHQCQFCGQRLFQTRQLKTHMERLHKNHNVFQCLICRALFPTKKLLTVHSKMHKSRPESSEESGIMNRLIPSDDSSVATEDSENSRESLECPSVFCKQTFSSVGELGEHVSKEHALPQNFSNNASRGGLLKSSVINYQCNTCHKQFGRSDWYEEHLLTHGKEADKPYQCQVCFKRYSRPAALASHEKTHSADNYFRCFICQKKFQSLIESKRHGITHRDAVDGRFHCFECPNVYDTFEAIKQHCRYKHAQKTYSCHLCAKSFPRSDKLRLHMLSHSTEKQWLCSFCGKQFKRKDKLREHQKKVHKGYDGHQQHTYTEPQDTSSEEQLSGEQDERMDTECVGTQNQASASKELDLDRFIFRCDRCSKGFKRRGMMINHMTSFHSELDWSGIPELSLPLLRTERVFDCEHCGKSYRYAHKRKEHHLKHHPDLPPPISRSEAAEMGEEAGRAVGQVVHLPFQCPHCPKQYTTRSALLSHVKTVHAVSNNQLMNVFFPSQTVEDGTANIVMSNLIPTTQAATVSTSVSELFSPNRNLPALQRRPEYSQPPPTGTDEEQNYTVPVQMSFLIPSPDCRSMDSRTQLTSEGNEGVASVSSGQQILPPPLVHLDRSDNVMIRTTQEMMPPPLVHISSLGTPSNGIPSPSLQLGSVSGDLNTPVRMVLDPPVGATGFTPEYQNTSDFLSKWNPEQTFQNP